MLPGLWAGLLELLLPTRGIKGSWLRFRKLMEVGGFLVDLGCAGYRQVGRQLQRGSPAVETQGFWSS